MSLKHTVTLKINGKAYRGDCEPRMRLVDFIRDECRLTGTHIGCDHGVCGACTVLINGKTTRSCLMLAVQADGSDITTVEGLAKGDQLHPIQVAFSDCHGLQCGFCTPGMMLTACEFLEENPDPTKDEIRDAISGNLCRCTGYQFIVDSIATAAARKRAEAAAD